MKRRGFLGSLLALVGVPAAVAAAPRARMVGDEPSPEVLLRPGSVFYVDAERLCNPPIIVDENGDFMRMYRQEFIRAFESKQSLLRDVVTGRR